VQLLQNFPRYTLSFHRLVVEPGTVTSNWNDYHQSLLFYILAPVSCCMIFIILNVSSQIFCRYRANLYPVSSLSSSYDQQKRIRIRKRRCLLSVFLGVIDVALLCVAINWNFSLTDSVQTIVNYFDMPQYQEQLKKKGEIVNFAAVSARNNISQLLQLSYLNPIKETMLDIESYLLDVTNASESFINQISNSTIPNRIYSAFGVMQREEIIRSEMTSTLFFLLFCCLFFRLMLWHLVQISTMLQLLFIKF